MGLKISLIGLLNVRKEYKVQCILLLFAFLARYCNVSMASIPFQVDVWEIEGGVEIFHFFSAGLLNKWLQLTARPTSFLCISFLYKQQI